MNMYIYKKATPADALLIRQLASEIWEPTYGSILSEEQLVYMFEMMYAPSVLAEHIEKRTQLFFIVYGSDLPVAYFSLEKEREDAYVLQKIYAIPSMHGKGVGRYMLYAIEEYIRSVYSESFHLKLFVNRENKTIEFYKHHGFVISGSRDHCIGDNYYMNDYIMTKSFEKKL